MKTSIKSQLFSALLASTVVAWVAQATILTPPAPDGKIPRDVGGNPGVAPALDWDTVQGIVLGAGGRGQPASVPQFDPALGTLTKATLRIYQFETVGTLSLKTLSNPTDVYFEEVVQLTLYPANDYPHYIYDPLCLDADPLNDPAICLIGFNPGTPLLSKANSVLTVGTAANPVDLPPNSSLSYGANYSLPTPCDLVYTGAALNAFKGLGTLDYVLGTESMVSGHFPDVFGAKYEATGRLGIQVIYEYTPSGPSLKLLKTADPLTPAPFQPVTYTYTVTNTGGVDLFNIDVFDDNGTPGDPSDDVHIGNTTPTIASLPAGSASVVLTKQLVPPVLLCPDNYVCAQAPPEAGIVATTLGSGDVKITYYQNFGINDNTYGTGMVGWINGSHTFGNLVGSDKLEFRIYDNATPPHVVLDAYIDCISQVSSVTFNGKTINYPSGYGTKGPFGSEGSIVQGNSAHVVGFSTSISDNVNLNGNYQKISTLSVDSPTSGTDLNNLVVDLTKAPAGWNPINTYSITVSAAAFTQFGGTGFGKVEVPDQHNSPNKQGCAHQIITKPCEDCVVNTATAVYATSSGGVASSSTTASAQVCVTVPGGGGGGGSGWISADVGKPKKAGSAIINPPSFTIDGGGKDIGGSKDQFQYVYQSANGNCTIIAKVTSVENTDKNAKAGVMIRETTSNEAPHVSMFVTPGEGIQLRSRDKSGGNTAETKTATTFKAPYWVKVVRSGNSFTGYYSADGLAWTQLGTAKAVNMSANVLIGLAVTSHKDDKVCTAGFENVSVTSP